LLYSELQMIKDFPCLTCPFLRVIQGGKPMCTIYANQAVGLESCKEVAKYLKENSLKQLRPDSILVFTKDKEDNEE